MCCTVFINEYLDIACMALLLHFISLPSSINSDINSAGGWYIEGRVVRAYTDGYWYAVDVEFSF